MATSDLFPTDADEQFDGDPPTRDDERHDEEVAHIIFEFEKVSRPGVYVAFELRNAVGSFAVRRSKLPLDATEGLRMKAAVGSALRTALSHKDTKGMKFLRRGCAAICEAIDAWVAPDDLRDRAKHIRNMHIGLLKHETAIADMVSTMADFSPAAWCRRQRDQSEPLF